MTRPFIFPIASYKKEQRLPMIKFWNLNISLKNRKFTAKNIQKKYKRMTMNFSKCQSSFFYPSNNYNWNNNEEKINVTDEIHATIYNFVDISLLLAIEMNCVLKSEMSKSPYLCMYVYVLCFTTTDVRMVWWHRAILQHFVIFLTAINSLST